jgi:hypothetical protein
MSVRADGASAIAGAERLAGVLDEGELVGRRQLGEAIELGRVTEDVDDEDSPRVLGDRGAGRFGIHVERAWIDVDEDRSAALVEDRVGGGDERERRRDDLVARADAGQAHGEVQAGRPARDGGDLTGAYPLGQRGLEPVDHRPQGEPP